MLLSTARRDQRNLGPTPLIGSAAFLAVVIVSLGGPLALAALYIPAVLNDASRSAGFVSLAGALLFGFPLVVWLRYSRHITSSGGLYSFVCAAAGRRIAQAHAVLWIASYLLYLLYTTAAIVYDTLPTVLPGVAKYRPLLEVLLPIVIAAVVVAGRAVTLAVIGILAVGQLVLVLALAVVAVGHDAPAGSLLLHAPAAPVATASAQVALLYVCGSLPLYLGGEVATPRQTVRKGMTVGVGVVGLAVTAAVFPLTANPAFIRAPIPGMALAQVFSGRPLAIAIGVGVAASTAGVMLVELVALSRLGHVLTGRSLRQVVLALSAALVVAGPISLINPTRFYDDLLTPSLVALWLSQLVVFAVYPRFAARHGGLRMSDLALTFGAVAFAGYGLYASVRHGGT